MTKYILHGGNTGNKSIDNKYFFQEIAADLPKQFRVLCVYYAKVNKNKWSKLLDNDVDNFSSALSRSDFDLIMADENPETFVKQAKQVDAIYIRGGESTHVLLNYLRKIDNPEALFKNITVAGSSAGACALATYFYENGDLKSPFNKGLAILPIKLFCHFSSDQLETLEALNNYGKDISAIHTIPDEKCILIRK